MSSSGRGRVLPKERLYRKCGWVVMGIVAIWCLGITPMVAQMPQLKRPEEAPVERPSAPPPKKLVNEPRAVGVLQLNKSGKGTLIPIAIRIDGKFYDASVYKANPVPMALDVGTVYEVEKTGQSEGLFTVSGALHNQNPDSATPWLGAGAYALNGTVVVNNIHKAEDKPRGLDDDNDAPPRLTRGKDESDQGSAAGSGGSGAPQKTSTAPTSSAPAAPTAGSQPGSESSGGSSTAGGSGPASSAGSDSSGSPGSDDSGRPQLKRASAGDSGSSAGQGTTAQGTKSAGQGTSTPPTTGSSSAPGASAEGAPAQSASNSASTPQGAQNPSSQNQSSQNRSGQNYYRPMLRRGKPTQSAPEDTPDELTRTTEAGISKTGAGAAMVAAKPAVQLVPAISDAGGPLPESFQFFWKQDEERDRKKQMLELAANSVRAYLAALAKDTIPAKPATTKASAATRSAGGHKSAAKVEPGFEDVDFRAFDVWRNNQPVMVLTAEAQLPEKAGSNTGSNSVSAPETYYVTVAARTDIYGDLRKLYAGVTDKFHLDVTPKLELIDAVDANGDGHGELLFRETTDAGNGYLIYRPTGDTLWKMFDSLNQE